MPITTVDASACARSSVWTSCSTVRATIGCSGAYSCTDFVHAVKYAEHILGDPNPPGVVAHAVRSSLEWCAARASRCARAAARTGREADAAADSITPMASGLPIFARASMARRCRRRMRNGDQTLRR
ncbi:MAG: hypothetical protein M0C28_18085 [Candidatus Moduliflexus flocculans]|nr:hypothetical protein [Candidatus Moduliflexus flocculans]